MPVVASGIVLFLVLATCCTPTHAAEPAGRVLFSSGEVYVVDAKGARDPLKRGNNVFPGDTIVTGDGRAQIRFTDGSLVSVKPNSQFRIDEYNYPGAPEDAEKGFFSLLKGGFRTVTGKIGAVNRDAYKVTTAVAVLGIRGTAYSLLLCQQDCANLDGSPLDDGLYAKVIEGIIFLANNAGSVDVAAGQSAFVRDLNTLPQVDGGPQVGPGLPAEGGLPTPPGDQRVLEPGSGIPDHGSPDYVVPDRGSDLY